MTQTFDPEKVKQFISRWSASSAAERSNKDMFFVELCDLLGVDRPDPSAEARPDYCFEKPVIIAHEDGRETTRFVDFYKKGFFVIEAKQGSQAGDATVGTARRGTATWDKAMRSAYAQALKYASYLPEGKPPFLITCDIGYCFEVWTGFTGDYGSYGARRTIELTELGDQEVLAYFIKIFTDPWDLDPARHAQRVTREVAAKLAELARALEADKHDPELVAQFLMRAIFTMFAEDVGLLPENLFTDAIRKLWIPEPRKFQASVEQLWQAMKDGLPFGFVGQLLRFNGGLFKTWQSLPMTEAQLRLLLEAAECDWALVEPAIFGTLVERALNPQERKSLGAHFTPREYIERLVRPAVIEPLRAEWEIVQAEARLALERTLTPGCADPSPAERERGGRSEATAGVRAARSVLSTLPDPKLTARAREFRKNPTATEKRLWEKLRNRQLDGSKFRRQTPIGPFIADFVCKGAKLVVEVDGPIHDQQVQRDRERDEYFEALGWRFLRIPAAQVEKDIVGVLAAIRVALTPGCADTSPAKREIDQAEARLALERTLTPGCADPSPAERERGGRSEATAGVRDTTPEPTIAQKRKAVAVIRRFHDQLVHTRVLDPACGSGNFLYVTLDLFKEIEAEVLRELADLGEKQTALEMQGVLVNPGQFLGIEINPRAREIADLVLWIGYLQWWRRTYGREGSKPPEPVLQEYKNIVCRDAVLAYDDVKPRLGDDGKPLTVWDMRTYKVSPVTGKEIPDEEARLPVLDYVNPRPADWPEADYVVSNPPFIGNKLMRKALGDGYVEALKETFPKVSGTADFVMFWWDKAAHLVREGRLKKFGFITTNSITQKFNRSVLEPYMNAKKNAITITWAIPDHPWVDSAEGAAVRIAMTVGEAGELTGKLLTVVSEEETGGIARCVEIVSKLVQKINSDLSGGADVASTAPLMANKGMSFMGMTLIGKGFRLNPNEVTALGYDLDNLPPVIRPHMNARELAQKSDEHFVIDMFGLNENEARAKYAPLYQWLLERVKPEREQNKDSGPKKNWWLFGRSRPDLREAICGLERFIITPITSKHRFFTSSSAELIPDCELQVVASDDSYLLGILSSRYHVKWALDAGSDLGPTPRWRNTVCFDPFPFPDATDEQKQKIRELGERLDAHRKRVQADFPDATLTAMYNSLTRLRPLTNPHPGRSEAPATPLPPSGRGVGGAGGEGLTEKEREFHDRALVGILMQIHDELDSAVAEAYGWEANLSDEEILERLVALNHERAAEEKQGLVRWLRPEFQDPEGRHRQTQPVLTGTETEKAIVSPAGLAGLAGLAGPKPWPKSVPDQLRAIRDLVASRPGTWSAQEAAAAFKRGRRAAVEAHLLTLEELGVLVSHDEGEERRWGTVGG